MEMPESYQFSKESFVYSTLRLDLMRKFEMLPNKILFEAGQTDRFLIDHFQELTDRRVTFEDVGRWRARQQEDNANFVHYLDQIYRELPGRWGEAVPGRYAPEPTA